MSHRHTHSFPKIFIRTSLISLLVIISLAAALNLYLKSLFINMKPPAVVVEIAELKKEPWRHTMMTTATLFSPQDAQLRSVVSGNIEKIFVQMGDFVEKGAPILQIEGRSAEAHLFQAESALRYAEYRFEQDKILFRDGALPEIKYQDSLNQLMQAQARLKEALDQQDDYHIKAPVSGCIGFMKWHEGDTVVAGDVLVSLSEMQPNRLRGSFSDRYYRLIEPGLKITALSAQGEVFDGLIIEKAPGLSGPLQRFMIEAETNTPVPLPSGSQLTIFTEVSLEGDDMFVIPSSALDINALGPIIWYAQQNDDGSLRAESVAISIVSINGDKAAIRGPLLRENMQVIVLGSFKLYTGAEIVTHVK